MTTDNGGPAFPRALPKGEFPMDDVLRIIKEHAGMTLLDYFAAKAMQSLLLAYYNEVGHGGEGFDIATRAYNIAASMLEARNA